MSKLIGRYDNGNYEVRIHTCGTKERETHDKDDTEFVSDFPESIDLHISNKCSNTCEFCYSNCEPDGKEADLVNLPKFFDTLRPFTELAVNMNSDIPEGFEQFLTVMKQKQIIVNMTVNQKQFMSDYFRVSLDRWVSEELIRGIGISLDCATPEFIELVKKYPNAVIHAIVGVTSRQSWNRLANNDLKVLILGYKQVGRGKTFYDEGHYIFKKGGVLKSITEETPVTAKASEVIASYSDWLKEELMSLMPSFKVMSFDNLALGQLDVRSKLSEEQWNQFYMGDDGCHTMYIDLVKGEYASDSLTDERNSPLLDSIDEMFAVIKKQAKDRRSRNEENT